MLVDFEQRCHKQLPSVWQSFAGWTQYADEVLEKNGQPAALLKLGATIGY